MKLCYVVKLKEVSSISPKAYKVEDYQGNTEIMPKSQMRLKRGNTWWATKWILEQKKLTYSYKSLCWVDFLRGKSKPHVTVEEYVPKKIKVDGIRDIEELHR